MRSPVIACFFFIISMSCDDATNSKIFTKYISFRIPDDTCVGQTNQYLDNNKVISIFKVVQIYIEAGTNQDFFLLLCSVQVHIKKILSDPEGDMQFYCPKKWNISPVVAVGYTCILFQGAIKQHVILMFSQYFYQYIKII